MALIPLKRSEVAINRKAGELFYPLHREMNRLMDDFFSSFPTLNLETNIPSVATPAVNVSESDKSYTVTAEMPGISEKDIEIAVSNGDLQIKGEKEISKEEKENGFIVMERSYGSFYRSIPFACKIEESKIKAILKDGVLTVEVPKAPEAIQSTKKVPIQKA